MIFGQKFHKTARVYSPAPWYAPLPTCPAQLVSCSQLTAVTVAAALWLQIVKTRHKMITFDVISRVFPIEFQQIYNCFCFRGMSFTLKTCQIVAGASMIR